MDKLTRLHDWFLEGSRREARAGARFIVWPEQNLLIFQEDEPNSSSGRSSLLVTKASTSRWGWVRFIWETGCRLKTNSS